MDQEKIDYLSSIIKDGVEVDDLLKAIKIIAAQETDKKLTQTRINLQQIYGDDNVYLPQENFIRVKNRNGEWNFFDQNQKPLFENWLEHAEDFRTVNGRSAAFIGSKVEEDSSTTQIRYSLVGQDQKPISEFMPVLTHSKIKKYSQFIPELSTPKKIERLSREQSEEKRLQERMLGITIDIPPFPPIITPEIKQILERNRWKFALIPNLYLGELGYLKSHSVESFLEEIHKRYPHVYSYEKLDSKGNPHNYNLNVILPEKKYWEDIKKGRIDFPILTGQWIAIKDMSEKYPNLSFNQVQTIIEKEKAFFDEIGLSGYQIRIPELIELNLINNRPEWYLESFDQLTNTKSVNGECLTYSSSYIGRIGSQRYFETKYTTGFSLAIFF